MRRCRNRRIIALDESKSGAFLGFTQPASIPRDLHLQNLDPQLFYDYADFLLGPRVRDLQAKDSGGNFLSRPPFSLVLSYEYQLRKRMAHSMSDGMSLKDALKMAMECSETREVHFLTPLLFASVPASSSDHGPLRSRSPRRIGQRRPRETREKQRQRQRQMECRKPEGRGERLACRDARWEEDLLQFQQAFWLSWSLWFCSCLPRLLWEQAFLQVLWASGRQRRWEDQGCSASGGPMTLWSE